MAYNEIKLIEKLDEFAKYFDDQNLNFYLTKFFLNPSQLTRTIASSQLTIPIVLRAIARLLESFDMGDISAEMLDTKISEFNPIGETHWLDLPFKDDFMVE